ncbi:hypothetical protein CRG98_035452 [Punica granatum]|uniref:MULE transposase domain-containing protein n=1 Tax=Punica granatum TaxID=22663 RepID=A0A2I0IJG2_PUNGR|nr:hypothetical protein CRG98_035452 [Punica granatum]
MRNPNSTVQVKVERLTLELAPRFERLYICFNATVQGFKAGCRPIICLDCCFLNGYYGGQLLAVVGQDGNQHFYVIALAVVDHENNEVWKRFVSELLEDIGDYRDSGWNFMSDRQKGLALALHELCPDAPHRNYVLQIWRNFAENFKNHNMTRQLWKYTRSSTMAVFEKNMRVMRVKNETAYNWLKSSKDDPLQATNTNADCFLLSYIQTTSKEATCTNFNSSNNF